ncbi:hypothetical protein V1477_015970 [Vespula maculifrons]|uniref:Uncharacterized protein n=1 Tax=Vespula maculifrons TaxID=7453 RepID=A0ABD2BBQ4_VESMC
MEYSDYYNKLTHTQFFMSTYLDLREENPIRESRYWHQKEIDRATDNLNLTFPMKNHSNFVGNDMSITTRALSQAGIYSSGTAILGERELFVWPPREEEVIEVEEEKEEEKEDEEEEEEEEEEEKGEEEEEEEEYWRTQ